MRLLLEHEVVGGAGHARENAMGQWPVAWTVRRLDFGCGCLHSTSATVQSNAIESLSDDYEREANVVVGRGDESPPVGGISYRTHLDLVGVAVRRTSNPLCTGNRCGMGSRKLTGLSPLGVCDNRQGRRVYTRANREAPIPRARCSQRLTDCDTTTARRINRRKNLWCLAAVADRCNKSVSYYRWQRRGFVVSSVTRPAGFLQVSSAGTRRSDTGGQGTKCDQAGKYGQYGRWMGV